MSRETPLIAASGFVLRTPLLPVSTLERLQVQLPIQLIEEGSQDSLLQVHSEQLAEAAQYIRDLLSDEVVEEAIYIASPALHDASRAWIEHGQPDPAIMRSLLAYLTRMSSRPTPFGLFANCSAGRFEDRSCTETQGRPGLRRTTRLDFGFLTGLVDQLEAMDGVRRAVQYYPNSSLYFAGGRLRMAERRVERARVRYHRVVFDQDSALLTVLKAAAAGATQAELAGALVDDDITRDEAVEYVTDLIDNQLLIADLGPAITGPDPVGRLKSALQGVSQAQAISHALSMATATLRRLDTSALGSGLEGYTEVADGLRAVEPELDVSRLFQVDSTSDASGLTLSGSIAREVAKGISLLHRVGGSDQDMLREYRELFSARYEDREVPLVEVLDEEVGLGFGGQGGPATEGAPLLAELPHFGSRSRPEEPAWKLRRENHLLGLLLEAARSGDTQISLSTHDVESLADPDPRPLPDALSAVVTLLSSPEGLDSGDFRVFLHFASGPSGAEILGRFAHADEAIHALVKQQLEREEALRPETIFAEIVHLPEGRVGNILARPVVRDHEIPFLGQSGAPRTAQLPVDDLLLSVRGGRFVLRSSSLGREVLPRLTSAHNHARSALAAYRFLAVLQGEGVAGALTWNWGSLRSAPFLPRVSSGRLVLQRARWLLSSEESSEVTRGGTSVARFMAVQELRARRRLPEWVVVGIADNELPINLTSATGCDLLHQQLKKGAQLLHERLVMEKDHCFIMPDGALLTHELVVPFTSARAPQVGNGVGRASGKAHPSPLGFSSDFLPGSEWLTTKLYLGKAVADGVLRDVIRPFASEWSERGSGGWFFMRYADPDWHLRVRFRSDAGASGEVLCQLSAACQAAFQDGRIARLQVDTYRREVARYGGPEGMLLSEAIFQADSDCVLTLLGEPGDNDLAERWKLGLYGVDRLLADLGFEIAGRQQLVRAWRDALAVQNGDSGTAARKLAGGVMRRERQTLEAVVTGVLWSPRQEEVVAAFDARSQRLAPLVEGLVALGVSGTLQGSMEGLAASYSHMFVNRLLRAAQPLQELVIYDLLDRLYSGATGRAKRAL